MSSRLRVLAMATALSVGVGTSSVEVASAGETAIPLAQGRVLDEGGHPAANTRIVMLAWPSDSQLARLSVGASFDRPVLATAETDKHGRYSLSADSLQALTSVADWGGIVNVDVVAEGIDGSRNVFSTPLTAAVGRAAKGFRPAGDAVALRPTASSIAVPDLTLNRWAKSTKAAETSVPKRAAAPQSLTSSCGTTYMADLGLHSALIGAHYDTTSYVRHDWEFSAGATATLGVGVSSTGGAGSWRASGTTTNTSSVTINWPESTGYQHVYTQYSWGKYRTRCYDGGNLISTTYQAKVRTLAGGASTWSPPSAPSAGYCTYYVKSSVFTKTQSKQTTHTTGADVSGVIGIDLSVQSGYTSASKVTFRFDEGRDLCGTKDFPAAANTSGLLVAKL